MSEIEHYVGKLTPVLDKTAEDICKWWYNKQELDSYYSSWEDMLEDISYRGDYQIIDGVIYKVELSAYEDSDDIFEGVLNKDGSIEVHVRFYNGGCSLTEALEYCINNAE